MAKADRAAPLTENEHVVELLSILRDNNAPFTNAFMEVLGHVKFIENQLEAAVKELKAMRSDLAIAEKLNHPIKNTLQKAVIAMQNHVLALRDNLTALKQSIIEGCKNAVSAFKEKGIAALDGIARFFKLRPVLEAIQVGANRAAQSVDKAIANIGAASEKYHEAGRRLKNAGRALTGKDAVQETKPSGKVARVFTVPFRSVSTYFINISEYAAVASKKLEQLEEYKPPVRETMRRYNEQIAREERAKPPRQRARSAPEL